MVSQMNREKFNQLVDNYDSQDEILISKIAGLIEKYPYFQLPRFLYTKSLKDQNKNSFDLAINQLALHSADRAVLKESIESKLDSSLKIEKLDFNVDASPEDYKTKKNKFATKSNIEEESITDKKELHNLEIKVDKFQKKDISQPLIKTSKKNLSEKSESKTKKFSLAYKDLKLNFLDWIQITDEKQITDITEFEKKEPLIEKLNIIDRFIETDPKMPPTTKTDKIELNIIEDFNSDELMTETLAKVLIKQKKYKKAISAYKILSLKYPEKNVFFAAQIQKIKKLQQE